MGCDIHSFTERRTPNGWENISFKPFDWRSYGMYAFLAGVRNYSAVTPIAEPRGLPLDLGFWTKRDADEWKADRHTESWLTVKELLDFNYDAEMEDRRYTKQEAAGCFNGGATCDAGQGKRMTWREFLGASFFRDLEMLRASGDPENTRIVFWFDN